MSKSTNATATGQVANHAPEWNALAYVRFGLNSGAKLLSQQRSLAYASECGEALRPVIRPIWVRASYALSWTYVCADTSLQASDHWIKSKGDHKQTALRTVDAAVFHTIASMAVPAFSIHTVVNQTSKILDRHPALLSRVLSPHVLLKVRPSLPTAIGLATIPFIVHPIDAATHWVMDRTVRRLYPQVAALASKQQH